MFKKTICFMLILSIISTLFIGLSVVYAAVEDGNNIILEHNTHFGTIISEYSEDVGVTQSGLTGYDALSPASRGLGAGKSAKWTPSNLIEGMYNVYLYKIVRPTAGDNPLSTEAKVDILHNSTTDTVDYDQSGTSGWVLIGTYNFNGDGTEFVRMRNLSTSKTLQADSVKFIPQIENTNADLYDLEMPATTNHKITKTSTDIIASTTVGSISVKPKTLNKNATVTIGGNDATTGIALSLTNGLNTFPIVVSSNGQTRSYSLKLTKNDSVTTDTVYQYGATVPEYSDLNFNDSGAEVGYGGYGGTISGYRFSTVANPYASYATWELPNKAGNADGSLGGFYNVRIWKVLQTSTAFTPDPAVRIEIYHNGKSEVLSMDQTGNSGANSFVDMGTYYFDGKGSEYVRLIRKSTTATIRTKANAVLITKYSEVQSVSGNPNLATVTVEGETLSPEFSGDTLSYSYTTTETDAVVKATAVEAGSAITVNGSVMTSEGVTVELTIGSNTISVVSTTENSDAVKTYTINVTREALPEFYVAETRIIQHPGQSNVPPEPQFTNAGFAFSGTNSYKGDGFISGCFYSVTSGNWAKWTPANLTAGKWKVYISNNFKNDNGSLIYNPLAEVEVAYGTSTQDSTLNQTIPSEWVSLGEFEFTGSGSEYVKITNNNSNSTVRTNADSIKMERLVGANSSSLSKIVATSDRISPAFNPATHAYTIKVPKNNPQITLATDHPNATIKIDGQLKQGNTPFELTITDNQVCNVVVTAPDLVSSTTYILTFDIDASYEGTGIIINHDYNARDVAEYTDDKMSNSGMIGYDGQGECRATNGATAYAKWMPSTLAIGTYKVYMFIPARALAAEQDKNVKIEVFHNGATSTSIQDQSGIARWEYIGEYDFAGTGNEYLQAIRQDAYTNGTTMMIDAARFVPIIKADNAKLSNITITNGVLAPAFSPNVYNYSASLFTDTVALTAETVNKWATAVYDESQINGSINVALLPGSNLAVITVTSADGTQTSDYTINLIRKIELPKFLDGSNIEIDSIQLGTIKSKIIITNCAENSEYTLIIGAYKDGELIDIDVDPSVVSSTGIVTLEASLTLTDITGVQIRAMVWDNFKNMMPLSPVKTF